MTTNGRASVSVPVLKVVDLHKGLGPSSIVIGLGPNKRRYEIRLGQQATPAAAAAELPDGGYPLAVRIEIAVGGSSGKAVSGSCLVRTARGPRRTTISVPAALSLLGSGTHGIIAMV